jgi:hypothetical protein
MHAYLCNICCLLLSRLSSDVLCYAVPKALPAADSGGSADYVKVLDNALPQPMLHLMQVCCTTVHSTVVLPLHV